MENPPRKEGDDTIKVKEMVKNFRLLIRLNKTVSGVDRLWVEFFHGAVPKVFGTDSEKEISETYNRIVTIGLKEPG